MKTFKYFLFLILIGDGLSGYSQRLTNREIYNFNQGDMIHTGYQEQSAPEFVKRTFVKKTVSVNNDTFYFTVLDSIYRLNSSQAWELSVESKQIFYSDLDNYPAPTLDSSYTDNCNTSVNYMYYTVPDTIIFEGHHYNLTAYKGLGSYLHYRNDFSSGGDETRYWLIYYCQSGNCCGERVQNLSLSADLYLSKLNLYPNPFGNIFNIQSNESGELIIYNSEGREIQKIEVSGEELTIQSKDFPSGVYTFVLRTNKGAYFKKLVKI